MMTQAIVNHVHRSLTLIARHVLGKRVFHVPMVIIYQTIHVMNVLLVVLCARLLRIAVFAKVDIINPVILAVRAKG